MLDKTNNDNTNKLYLNTAQYTLYDAENMDGIKSPITPLYGVQGNQTTEAQGGGASPSVMLIILLVSILRIFESKILTMLSYW